MVDEDITYETNTIRAIRGMESRTVAKWESEGWELVSQKPGKLQTEITFRRPKQRTRWVPWAIGGGAVVVGLTVIITLGVIGERNAALDETPSATTAKPSATTSEAASPSASTTEPVSSPEPEDVVLTPENNAEFAAILALTDYCDPSIEVFASAYRGRTIAFPGNIGAIAPHDGATTRYDILIGVGDFSETSAPGPAFQFRDVNTTTDLNFIAATPDTIGVGANLKVTAEVDNYESSSCLFLLEPLTTAVR